MKLLQKKMEQSSERSDRSLSPLLLALSSFADSGMAATFMPENTRSSLGNPWVASQPVWIEELGWCCRAAQAVL